MWEYICDYIKITIVLLVMSIILPNHVFWHSFVGLTIVVGIITMCNLFVSIIEISILSDYYKTKYSNKTISLWMCELLSLLYTPVILYLFSHYTNMFFVDGFIGYTLITLSVYIINKQSLSELI